MGKPLLFSKEEVSFLEELAKRDVAFIIVGLSAAALQGAPVVTQDIDLWFRDLGDPNIRKALRKVGATYVPPWSSNPPMFAGKNVRLFDIVLNVDGLNPFEEEFERALEMRLNRLKIKILPLERIIKSKKSAGRKKDKAVLPVLEDALIGIREREGG